MKIANFRQRIAKRLGRAVIQTKYAAGAAVLAGGMMFAGAADAQVLLSEDFEGLTLGPFVSDGESGGTGQDWTEELPAGWTRDNTTTPAPTPGDFSTGPIEFFGFTLMNKESWIATAGNQARDTFTKGTGTVVVADGDEYDDLTPGIEPDLMNVFLMTPEISLSGVAADSVVIEFDSSFRPYDTMTGLVDVSFDGGSSYTNLLTLDTASTPGGESSLDRADESVMLPVSNPADGNLMVRFGYVTTGNDWWWAIDNVQVSVVPEPTGGLMAGLGGALLGLGGLRRRRKP